MLETELFCNDINIYSRSIPKKVKINFLNDVFNLFQHSIYCNDDSCVKCDSLYIKKKLNCKYIKSNLIHILSCKNKKCKVKLCSSIRFILNDLDNERKKILNIRSNKLFLSNSKNNKNKENKKKKTNECKKIVHMENQKKFRSKNISKYNILCNLITNFENIGNIFKTERISRLNIYICCLGLILDNSTSEIISKIKLNQNLRNKYSQNKIRFSILRENQMRILKLIYKNTNNSGKKFTQYNAIDNAIKFLKKKYNI
jgi:hypothetical protein